MKKKHITVRHYCKECYDSIRYNQENAKPLLKHQLSVDIDDDFSISELSEVVKANIIKQTCKKHPNSKGFIRFSFFHEQTIEL